MVLKRIQNHKRQQLAVVLNSNKGRISSFSHRNNRRAWVLKPTQPRELKTVYQSVLKLQLSKMCEKKCVISLKRQHMLDEDDTPDVVLETKQFDSSFSLLNQSKKVKSESSSGSESESDGETDSNESNSQVCVSPVPEPSTSRLGDEEGVVSPVPGPSNMPDPSTTQVGDEEGPLNPEPGPSDEGFENITLEPLASSTPHHEDPEVDTDVDVDIDVDVDMWNMSQIRAVKSEVRETTKVMKDIKSDFLKDVQKTIRRKSKLYIPKLTERRSKISTNIYNLKQQKKRIDILLQSLNRQKSDIDEQIDNFHYFVANFPTIAD